jgi:hypothetical protein
MSLREYNPPSCLDTMAWLIRLNTVTLRMGKNLKARVNQLRIFEGGMGLVHVYFPMLDVRCVEWNKERHFVVFRLQ